MFGSDKVNGLNSNIAPVGLAILCYNNRIGFMGDNLGLSVKFCNDFFPTPTDSGICLTKNIDLNEILHIKEKHNSLFEPEPQQPTKKIDNGTTWGGISLILLPEQNIYSANPVRSPDSEKTSLVIKKLKIQLHQDHEIANIFKPNDYDDAIIPLILESNREYFIKVIPYGRNSSVNFRDLSIDQRNCRLRNETMEGSIFKLYTESNCRYECHTKLALEVCKCAPWDFMHRSDEKECDVFGRTCFYQTMENLIRDSDDHCSQCIQECDYMKYKREIVESRKIIEDGKEIGDEGYHWGNDYFTCRYDGYNRNVVCNGDNAFVEFFHDVNETFFDRDHPFKTSANFHDF